MDRYDKEQQRLKGLLEAARRLAEVGRPEKYVHQALLNVIEVLEDLLTRVQSLEWPEGY